MSELAARSQCRRPWSDEQVATLKRLWAEELSCAQIGKIIGKTRNAVAGKVYRLREKAA